MIIECPACHAKYQYDEQRFEGKPSKKIKCARCQQIFDIHNPAAAAAAKTPEPAPAAVAAPAGDSTFTSRGDRTQSRPIPTHDTTEQSPIPEPKPANALQLPNGKRLSLAVLDGPDAGTVFRVEKPRVTIGRAGADLTLNDSEASRQHAAVEIRDTSYTVSDLGSTNGTLVDGSRIEAPVELTDKSEFQVGSTTLMLIVTEDH